MRCNFVVIKLNQFVMDESDCNLPNYVYVMLLSYSCARAAYCGSLGCEVLPVEPIQAI